MAKVGELNGFLDEGCLIEGTVTFQETLRIDGTIKGKVVSRKDLIIGPSGVVEGEITVGVLQVSGTVMGNVRAAQKIFIHRGGRLFADISTPNLIIEEGAIFQGSCAMEGNERAEIKPIREGSAGR